MQFQPWSDQTPESSGPRCTMALAIFKAISSNSFLDLLGVPQNLKYHTLRENLDYTLGLDNTFHIDRNLFFSLRLLNTVYIFQITKTIVAQ